jgi:hypothetical protein
MLLYYLLECRDVSQTTVDLTGIDDPYLVPSTIAGVLDKPYSQLTPLSRVAVQARQST